MACRPLSRGRKPKNDVLASALQAEFVKASKKKRAARTSAARSKILKHLVMGASIDAHLALDKVAVKAALDADAPADADLPTIENTWLMIAGDEGADEEEAAEYAALAKRFPRTTAYIKKVADDTAEEEGEDGPYGR